MSQLAEALAAHPFLAGLDPQHLQLILPCASLVSFPINETFVKEGEEARHLYLLRSGRVAVTIHRPRRGQRTVYSLGEGDVVGMGWLDLPQYWFFDVRSVELTRAIALEAACLAQVTAAHPDLGYELLQRFARLLLAKIRLLKLQLVDFYGS